MNVNMSTEEFIKYKTDEYFNNIKEKSKEKSVYLVPMEELYFKMGVAYGVSMAGLALVNIDTNNLIKGE